jgi:hypothetical protein
MTHETARLHETCRRGNTWAATAANGIQLFGHSKASKLLAQTAKLTPPKRENAPVTEATTSDSNDGANCASKS